MVLKRKHTRSKSGMKRRSGHKKKRSGKLKHSKILKSIVKRDVKEILKQEPKYTIGSIAPSTISATSTFTLYALLPSQGTATDQRLGSMCNLQSWTVKFRFQNFINQAALAVFMGTNYNIHMRIIFGYVKNALVAVAPVLSDIYYTGLSQDFKLWHRRIDTANNWFKITKVIDFTVPACPSPGGNLNTTLATQQTQHFKTMTKTMHFGKNGRNTKFSDKESVDTPGSSGTFGVGLNQPTFGRPFMLLTTDSLAGFSLEHQLRFLDFP